MKLGEVSGPFFTQLTKDMEVKREQHGELYSPSCEGTAVFRGAGQQCASVVREDISGRSICPRHDLSGIGSPDSGSVGVVSGVNVHIFQFHWSCLGVWFVHSSQSQLEKHLPGVGVWGCGAAPLGSP